MGKHSVVKGVLALAAVGAGALAVRALATRTAKGRAIRSAAEDIKNHVADRITKLGKVTKKMYGKIVDGVIGEYQAMKGVSEQELEKLSAELKGDWERIRTVFKQATDEDDEPSAA